MSEPEQRPGIPPATGPADKIISIISHNNKLVALCDDSTIWWVSDDGTGKVTWTKAWPETPGGVSL